MNNTEKKLAWSTVVSKHVLTDNETVKQRVPDYQIDTINTIATDQIERSRKKNRLVI